MISPSDKQRLKEAIGPESPIGKAWLDYYGPAILSGGLLFLPYSIEQFYPQTGADEWELAVILMIINCSELSDGPVATLEPRNFASRFHLSPRHIRRRLKTMVEKGLIIITPLYDDKGKKTTFRLYDCSPFLDKIFACICADDDWARRHSEHLESIGIDEDIDDIDLISTAILAETSMSPDTARYSATSMSSQPIINKETSMSSPLEISSRTSMSQNTNIPLRTSMSQGADASSRTDMSSQADTIPRTSMSPSSDTIPRTDMSSQADATSRTSMSQTPPTSYAHAHIHMRDSSSNSSSNNINNNIILSSNSNSKHASPEIFATEDNDDIHINAACSDESQADEDVRMTFEDAICEQANAKSDSQARFERWVLDAVEQVNEADELAAKAAEKASEAIKQTVKADEQPMSNLAMLTMLPARSREALASISSYLHDAQPQSSQGRARRLYNQLLTINQVEDAYAISDPDHYFSELLHAVKYHIRHKIFTHRDQNGQPNGMPLFFHELRKRIEGEISAAEQMRRQ